MAATAAPQRCAVIDCAQDERLLPHIRAMVAGARCLFDDPLDPELAAAAPWLVPLRPDEGFLSFWLREGRGRPWGLIVESQAPFDELRRHWKKLLKAQLPGHGVVLFRCFDPRVLPVVLAASEPPERARLFGPMERIHFEDPDTGRPVTLTASAPAPAAC